MADSPLRGSSGLDIDRAGKHLDDEGGSAAGHITMFDGTKWVSDFTQTDMWSGPGYRTKKPAYALYRP